MNIRKQSIGFWALVALCFSAVIWAGCEDDTTGSSKAGTYYGPAVSIGDGQMRSYVQLDANGWPTEVGISLSRKSLDNLPDHGNGHGNDHELNKVLHLPAQASATAIDHIEVNWNPEGHEPPGVYDLPHFDFHFYMIDSLERNKITAVGDDTLKLAKMPPLAQQPTGYVPTPGGVPRMGAHWIDPTSPELNGQVFTKTFIYGFYDGRMVFLEPMITRAFLLSNPNVTETLKVPQLYPVPGYHPTNYSVRYDATRQEYMIALGAMKEQ
jgi:hypothetical protein